MVVVKRRGVASKSSQALFRQEIRQIEELVRLAAKLGAETVLGEKGHDEIPAETLHLIYERDIISVARHENACLVMRLLGMNEHVRREAHVDALGLAPLGLLENTGRE